MRSNHIRTTALAATALLAALSLTACSGNDNGNDGKAGAVAPAASTTPTTPDTGKEAQETGSGTADAPAENASAAPKGSTGATDGQKSNAGTTGGQKSNAGTTGSGSKSSVTCTGANTRVTVSKVSRPINHLLLTATNTGSSPCYAYHAPAAPLRRIPGRLPGSPRQHSAGRGHPCAGPVRLRLDRAVR